MKLERRLVGVSSAVMLTAGFLLSSASAWAEDTSIDEVTITVPSSCTMTGTLNTAHTTSLLSGETANNIGTTTLKVICNDSAGYAIYAIGYTDDEDGKTVLTSSTLGSSYDIATSTTVTTGTSSWAMKLATSESGYLPVIVGSTGDSEKTSSTPDFSNYVAVPTEYTRVAYRNSATDVGTGALGSSLTTTYRVYVSGTQPAGTYIGQVKYTMVHPSNTAAPIPPLRETDCPAGYVCYAPNSSDIEGSMATISNETIASSPKAGKISVGQSASATPTLIAPNYKRSGYGFAGWSTDFEATNSSTIYGPNETITVNLSSSGLILYPVWIAKETNLTMQTFNSTNYANYSSAPNGTVIALEDERDHDVYAVAKLADGKWWMIENLRLDDSATLTTTNTHNPLHNNNNVILKTDYNANTTAAHLAASNSGSWCTSANAACYDQTILNTNNTRLSDSSLTASYNGSNATSKWYSYGNYYNWYSATAGNGTYSFGTNNNSVTGDLCPASWHLPKGGNKNNSSNSEFWALGVAIVGTEPANTSSSTQPYYTRTPEGTNASNAIRTYPNNFVYSGYWNGAQAGNRSSSGSYWSSSAGSSDYAYNLYLSSSNVYPGTDYYYKYYGRSVRCVAGS